MTTTRVKPDVFVPPSARRGVALLLVLMTLGTAVVLTTAFLASRENAPEIGSAAQDRVTAEWAARSTADIVTAAMETTVDWRTPAMAGTLFDNPNLLGADVCVAVTNLEGGAVSADDRHVLMTVTATVGGIETVVQRVISEHDHGGYTEALDPELNEFGAYAANEIDIDNNSRVVAWPASPSVRAGAEVKLGMGFTSASDVTARSGSLPNQATAFLAPTASAALDTLLDSYGVEPRALPVDIWSTTSEIPSALIGLPGAAKTPPAGEVTSDTDPLDGGGYGVPIRMTSGANIVLDGAQGPYLFAAMNAAGGGLEIENAVITVRGDVIIGVVDEILIKDTKFILEDDATLSVYHGADLEIENAVIGADPDCYDKATRSYADIQGAWADPRRVRFTQLTLSALDGTNLVELRGRSLVAGSIHAPTSRVRIADNSALAGRVSAGALELSDHSALLVDPIFDNRMGLTESDGPLYDAAGDLLAGLKAAMESTTPDEGFAAAKARLMAALPTEAVIDDTFVAGATRRHPGTVSVLREWPVWAHLQENREQTALFEPPQDETVANALGDIVRDIFDRVVNDDDGDDTGASTKSVHEIASGLDD